MSERNRVKILSLNASPESYPRVRGDEEAREVDKAIRSARYGEEFEFITKWAVTPTGMVSELEEHCPAIVHYSGHGIPDMGLLFEDDERGGVGTVIGPTTLARVFQVVGGDVRLVVLNACHSKTLADKIVQMVDCVVGLPGENEKQAAICFARSFYGAIASGSSVQDAYERALLSLSLDQIEENAHPILVTAEGGDASALRFYDEDDIRRQEKRRSGSSRLLIASLLTLVAGGAVSFGYGGSWEKQPAHSVSIVDIGSSSFCEHDGSFNTRIAFNGSLQSLQGFRWWVRIAVFAAGSDEPSHRIGQIDELIATPSSHRIAFTYDGDGLKDHHPEHHDYWLSLRIATDDGVVASKPMQVADRDVKGGIHINSLRCNTGGQ